MASVAGAALLAKHCANTEAQHPVPLRLLLQKACSTCVSQAVATAMQMAAAAAMEQDVDKWEVGEQSRDAA
jgi:hypothetical protein